MFIDFTNIHLSRIINTLIKLMKQNRTLHNRIQKRCNEFDYSVQGSIAEFAAHAPCERAQIVNKRVSVIRSLA